MMQVYTPASFSVTSVMVRLSESTINLQTKQINQTVQHHQIASTFSCFSQVISLVLKKVKLKISIKNSNISLKVKGLDKY